MTIENFQELNDLARASAELWYSNEKMDKAIAQHREEADRLDKIVRRNELVRRAVNTEIARLSGNVRLALGPEEIALLDDKLRLVREENE